VGCREGVEASELKAAPPTTDLRLSAPERVRFSAKVSASGSLKARDSAMLAFQIPGTLAQIHVDRGQEVAQGAVLATLDSAAAYASLAQARAGLKAAEAQDRLAQDNLDRVTIIRKGDGASEAQLVQAQAQRDLAAAQRLSAQAQIQQAEVHLRNHTLKAPFSGVVTKAPDGTGATVMPGVPLFGLESTRRLILETSLTQHEAAQTRVGAKGTVLVPALGLKTDEAQVKVVVPSVDPSTNRVPIEVEVPNGEGRFLPHAFARVELAAGAERDALKVSTAALIQKEGAYSVWIATAEGTVKALAIHVLGQDGDGTVIDAGGEWPAGARVIDLPPLGIAEGAQLGGAAR
jgi:RND family efflux transporter MFP subunit